MLLAYSEVCFAVLLAVFCHAQALAPSHDNNNLPSHGFGNETRCSWNCTAVESDLTEEMKIAVDSKETLIQLVVKYEKKVDDKCVNQTSRNSSAIATEHLQILLANKERFTVAKLMESLKNPMFNTNPDEERKEIRVLCTLRPSGTTGTTLDNNGVLFSLFFRGHLAAFEFNFNTTDRDTEKRGNLEPYQNITDSTGYNSTDSKNPLERGGWPVAVLYGFCFIFYVVFLHYSLAFICLLSPTEVTEGGVRQIVLEEASPVSFGSLIGNYFFSEDDGTIWHKARKFVFRVVIIPLPFLCLGIHSYLEILSSVKNNFFHGMVIVCSVCYFIHASYISFFTMMLMQAKPCSVCKYVRPKIFSCRDELPMLIKGHLRLQPLILVKCCQLFIRCMSRYFKTVFVLFPKSKVSFAYLLRLPILIICISMVPPVALILSIMILLLAFVGIAFSSPIVMLCNARFSAINLPFFIVWIIRYCIASLAAGGVIFIITFASLGSLMALLSGMILLLSEESLPYLACIVLVLYYVWSSYNSFTTKYQDLALALFKHYKKSRSDKFFVKHMDANTDQVEGNVTVYIEDDEMKIPKRLFQIACEELMPIREGLCKMIVKITIIASFVLLVFSIAMLRSAGANPVMKALSTFLTGLFPKIFSIYMEGGGQRKLEAMVTDEKIPNIMQEYIKQTNRTTETSKSNQEQENFETEGDAEVISLNDNEENIPLINT